MIEQALRYQTKGEDWVKRVAIGGGLLLFSLFIVPVFTVYGYMLEVIRDSLRGDLDTPPAWGDYDLVDLTINGLKAFVILFAYSFVFSIIAWVPSTLLGVMGGALDIGALAVLGTLVYFVLSLAGSLATAVIAPVALSNFVIKEDISAGFDIDVLKNIVPEMAMLRAVGLGIAISIITAIASGVVSILVITVLIVPFILFVGISGMALVWGQGFATAYRNVYGDLPAIPDGPLDRGAASPVGDSDSTTAGASTASATATSSSSADTPSNPDDSATNPEAPTSDPKDSASDDGSTTSDDDSEKKDGYWDN